LPLDAPDTEIHIDNTGAGAFFIRFISVRPKTWMRDLHDNTYGAAVTMVRTALNKFAASET
jgi:hypothetical protein